MAQDRQDFSAKKIASLARLQLSVSESATLQSQMTEVLEFIGQIESVDLADVEPYFGTTEGQSSVRADDVRESLPREDVLQNAPKSDDEYYLVPPVFG